MIFLLILTTLLYIVQFGIIQVTSSADASINDTYYMFVREDITIKHSKTISTTSGNKVIRYKDTFQLIRSTLESTKYTVIYEWEDSSTSQSGLIIHNLFFNTLQFFALHVRNFNIKTNGFLSINYDDDYWLFIIWKEDDGTLSTLRLIADGSTPSTYVKLKMPVYQAIWGSMFTLGSSSDYFYYIDNNKLTLVGHNWNSHPVWCTEFESETGVISTIGGSTFTLTWIDLPAFVITDLSIIISPANTVYTDASSVLSHGDFSQLD